MNHKRFYGYAGEFEVVDMSKPVYSDVEQYSEDKGILENVSVAEYPFTKIEEGISLNKEIDVLRQAVYELKLEIEELKKNG